MCGCGERGLFGVIVVTFTKSSRALGTGGEEVEEREGGILQTKLK